MAKENSNGKSKPGKGKSIETFRYPDARRANIPTAELRSVMEDAEKNPIELAYARRNMDVDPQLVWRGKDAQDELKVKVPPLFIQEKIHPKVLIDDLKRMTKDAAKKNLVTEQLDLFGDFNGVPAGADKTEFYKHDQNWTNRMILGDSAQVMASLAEREGLRGKVQCIYFDPPYGIKFNSNFQWSTTSRDVKDGNANHITREPEQVKAFRDTWRDGIHSYLTYLRDRFIIARDLLTDSGSIFVQISDENVHRVRALLDEIFGEENFISQINFRTAMTKPTSGLNNVFDYIVWYTKKKSEYKYRPLYIGKDDLSEESEHQLQSSVVQDVYAFIYRGTMYNPPNGWRVGQAGISRLACAERLYQAGLGKGKTGTLKFVRTTSDFPYSQYDNSWNQQSSEQNKIYVVQTAVKIIQRCLLMTTDPGDLILDPTCGSGTTAYVAEQWGRRWMTIDTSRVAMALARARIMGAKYPFYLLADSREGQIKEGELTARVPSEKPTYGNIRHGFIYERVPHVTLKSIANNTEIDVIWEEYQKLLEPLRHSFNKALDTKFEEWEIPHTAEEKWHKEVQAIHADWWKCRIERQKKIDASIAAKAESEYLYDRPYEDKSKVRVAGPFTIESSTPHRTLIVDENGNPKDPLDEVNSVADGKPAASFDQMILQNLKTAGVQQANKTDKIDFSTINIWPGTYICAEGFFDEAGQQKRAAIFIGPEFGTVTHPDITAAAREAADCGFNVLITCAFSYEAQVTDLSKVGKIPILKARINADLHMADDLKNTGKGNLFVIFGEPDIDLIEEDGQFKVHIRGVDVFDPIKGEIRSDDAANIACWFIDTDYNESSFFVRHAYFLGANDPYKSLRVTLKADIDPDAWESIHSDTSRPFDRPSTGRIAIKVINHLGDEVMKVFNLTPKKQGLDKIC